MAEQRYLVTMALPYANGDIHLGHLLEAVQTDIFVRYQKLRGNEAVFVCADDTHGTPIEISAIKRKITPEALIAEAHANHSRDYAGFNIGFDIFYSTNSEENRRYAELVFENLRKNGLVVERDLDQFYCDHDKRFLPDRFVTGTCPKCGAENQYGDVCEACGSTYQSSEIREPRCVICGNPPVMKQSRHFYVRLDRCEEFLRTYVSGAGVLQDDMRNFVTSWIDDGLREWCVSRDGPYFGFRIPGTENKYFYVWLDAPIGYLSSTDRWCTDHGRRVEEFWKPDSGTRVVHFIGKDIVYFHALFWPVMLANSEFSVPSTIFVHGFLNVKGEKMSKSRGTFILARDFLAAISHPQAPEYLRFFYAAKLAPTTTDIDLSPDEFMQRVNTTLANNFGNLHHRTFVFCERYFDGKIPDEPWDEAMAAEVESAALEIAAAYERSEYRAVVERIHALGNLGNKFYQDSRPWELVKHDKAKAAHVMVTCANIIKAMAVFLRPITPVLCAALENQLGMVFSWDDHRFSLVNHPLTAVEKLVNPLAGEHLAPLFGTADKFETEKANTGTKSVEGLIDINEFRKTRLCVGKIVSAEKVEKSKKLLKLSVNLGPEDNRQILAGIAEHYPPETLIGKSVVVVANLKPATLMGQKSEGMLLAAGSGKTLSLLTPDQAVEPGSPVS